MTETQISVFDENREQLNKDIQTIMTTSAIVKDRAQASLFTDDKLIEMTDLILSTCCHIPACLTNMVVEFNKASTSLNTQLSTMTDTINDLAEQVDSGDYAIKQENLKLQTKINTLEAKMDTLIDNFASKQNIPVGDYREEALWFINHYQPSDGKGTIKGRTFNVKLLAEILQKHDEQRKESK